MKKLHLLIFISSFLVFQSCLEPVELDLPVDELKLVLESNFTENQSFEIIVTKNKSFEDGSRTIHVTNAEVLLYCDGKLLEQLAFFPAEGGKPPRYVSTTKAEIGKHYEINVSAPGFKPISSTGYIPEPSRITSSELQPNPIGENSDPETSKNYWLSVEIQDKPKVDNYYHLIMYQEYEELLEGKEGQIWTSQILGPLKMFSPSSDGSLKFYLQNRSVFITDRSFNGQNQKFLFNTYLEKLPTQSRHGKIIIELRTVSKDYYDYYLTLQRKTESQQHPLSEPIIDFSNIENGFGIFAGFSVVTSKVPLN